MIYVNISTCICIYRTCMHIVFILQCPKFQNNRQIVWKKSRNKCRSYRVLMGSSWSPDLYCSRFLPSDNMNQVPEKIYLGQWSCITKKNQSMQFDCPNRTNAYSFIVNWFFFISQSSSSVKHLRLFNITQKNCSIQITNN
jgi:hypothetical protein